jgi:hexokinase
MMTPEEFLESNGLATRTIDRAGLVSAFQKEMEAGLAGEPSSLKMIPTFTSPYGDVAKDTPVTVLDAGGTNFRAGTVTIPSDGSDIKIDHVEKSEMPGAKSFVSEEDFYATLTDQVTRCAPFAKDNAVGFCFSYPAEASADGDAKLIVWTKQIQAPAIVGQWVGAEMSKRLDPKPSKITVVNDTVATLLAGKAIEKGVRYSAYLGFILGTGTNVAYIEKNENIGKLKNAPAGAMAINTESGGFSKIAQSAFDEAMDKKTADCGAQRFEKMIAGAYLGRIGLEVFKAAAREGFFTEEAKRAVLQLGTLESYDLDNFCAKFDNGKPNPLNKVFTTEQDCTTARRLATPVFERAAILTAIHLAAFIIKTGGGTDPEAPVSVCIDGSTYYKTRVVSFPEIVTRELDAMLAARNISYALTVCPDCAPMVGAAVAALLK